MKLHHEYQIYYGGFKIKLKKMYFCEDCNMVLTKLKHQIIKGNVRSHKKQTGNLVKSDVYMKRYVISKKS